MASPATTADVEARYRTLDAAETTQAGVLLEDAWFLLQRRRPTVATDIVASPVIAGNVIRVLCDMVIRVLRNPEGAIQRNDGPFGITWATASGALTVTDDELDDITPTTAGASVRSLKLTIYGTT